MAKRFTDTEKWNDPWHRKELTPVYKCFWDYINAKCDRSGVWKVDMDQASFFINSEVDATEALKVLGAKRVHVLNPEYWQILGFIPFQFGKLSEDCRAHKDVLALIACHRVSKGYSKGINTLKDKDKEEDKDREGMGGGRFDVIWSRYPRRLGRKEAERHFKASVKTTQDWLDIQKALENYITQIRHEKIQDEFIKHGSTWFNNWRDYVSYSGAELPKSRPSKPREPDPVISDEDRLEAAKVLGEASRKIKAKTVSV